MVILNRRRLLQGGLVLAGSLVLPGLVQAKRRTDADRALLPGLDPSQANLPECFYLSRVRVHPLIRERMSLDRIYNAKIEVVDEAPNQNGYVIYYQAFYATVRQSECLTSGCALPPELMDEWIQRQGGWVLRNFARGRWLPLR